MIGEPKPLNLPASVELSTGRIVTHLRLDNRTFEAVILNPAFGEDEMTADEWSEYCRAVASRSAASGKSFYVA